MSELGRPRAFLADNTPGSGPVLYFGTHKVELDDETALQWWWVLSNWIRNLEHDRSRRSH
jgi:hypothetical protein